MRANRAFPVLIFLFIMLLLGAFRAWPAVSNNLGQMYLISYLMSGDENPGQLEQAAGHFARADAAPGGLPSAAWRLATTLFLLGRYDEAVRFFELAEASGSEDFLLRPTVGENRVASHAYWILKSLSEAGENPSEALEHFRRGLALDPQELDRALYRRYYDILAASADPEARLTGKRIGSLLDEGDVEAATFDSGDWMTVEVTANSSDKVDGCRRVDSVRYDGPALEQGPLVPLQVTWLRIQGGEAVSETEAFVAVNLAPNAGFEWGIENGQPVGYPDTIYVEDNPEVNHRLRQEERAQEVTMAAALENTDQNLFTSFASRPITVEADQVYLQGGWMRNEEGGHASLGHLLRGDDLQVDTPFQIISGGELGQEWQFFAQEMTIPAGTESVDFWLRNYDSAGSAFFDDLLFFKIDVPKCD